MMYRTISEALDAQFAKHRILFWYDDDGSQKQSFNEYETPGVEKIEIAKNEFAVKYRMLNADVSIRFLVYSPAPDLQTKITGCWT